MDNLIKKIDYDELIKMFDLFDTGFVMIGGDWCPNCTAVMDNVINIAKDKKLDTIYYYDPKFKNIYGEIEDLRDCKSLEVKLKYYAIVEKMGFKSEERVKDTLIARIHVPCFMAIRHGICVDYYVKELLKDNNILHEENSNLDKTQEFEENIKRLIDTVKKDELMF